MKKGIEEHFLLEAMKEHFPINDLKEINLINSSINKMYENTNAIAEEFDIFSYDEYHWLEDRCFMEFLDHGVPKIIAQAQHVGSITCKEWYWSWAKNEENINTNCKEKILLFKKYIKQYDFPYLVKSSFKADERIGWVMAAIVAHTLKSKLIYKIDRYEATEFYVFSKIVKL